MRVRAPVRVTAVGIAAAALLAAAPTAVAANVPSGSRNQRQVAGVGYQSWDQGSDKIGLLKVNPDRSFRSGWCLDSWFDWTTQERPGPEDGRYHFDGRVVRTCNSHVGYGKSFADRTRGRDLRGMQKAGTCYGPRDKTTAREGNCNNARGHSITITNGRMNAALPNRCTRSWRIDASARTPIYDAGGVSKECRR